MVFYTYAPQKAMRKGRFSASGPPQFTISSDFSRRGGAPGPSRPTEGRAGDAHAELAGDAPSSVWPSASHLPPVGEGKSGAGTGNAPGGGGVTE